MAMTQIIGTGALIALMLVLASVTHGQTRASADIGGRNGKTVMFAAYGLYDDPGDCTVRKYSGTIIKVQYDYDKVFENHTYGFTVLSPRGQRTYFDLDPSLYKDPRADIRWLPTLIRKSNRVRVDAYVCGASGGVMIANNVISVRAPSTSAKSRRRHHSGNILGQYSLSQRKRRPDRIKATKSIEGRFVNFEVGDYIHAMIRKSDGQTISFFLIKPGMEYFLALHKNEPLKLTYQIVDTYLPEADGMETIKSLISAKAGNLTYAVWWKDIRTKFTMAQLRKKYDPLVQESTIEP